MSLESSSPQASKEVLELTQHSAQYHSDFHAIMNASRLAARRLVTRQLAMALPRRSITTTNRQLKDDNPRVHTNADEYREHQQKKEINPHLTNTTSTISNDMPSIGKDKAPPEMLSAVDPDFTPKDRHPENTERMTGGTQDQPGDAENKVSKPGDYAVGEMEGISFRVEPLRRTGEDLPTMRARLLCWLHPEHGQAKGT
jgi:hypothetical protein